jgi:imidazolonepropionase-like amidohydrolase
LGIEILIIINNDGGKIMLALKNGRVYTMTGKVLERGTVLIDEGKIISVGEELDIPNECRVIDVHGQNIMPGFIDAHCHLGLFENNMGFEGDDGNEITDPVTPQLRAIDGINPMDESFEDAYKAGVTCVATGPGSANVIGGQFAIIKTYGNRVDDMIVKESAAMKIAFGENPKRCYNALKKSPMTRMATASILRETLHKAKNYAKKVDDFEAGISEHQPEFDMKLEAMKAVMDHEIPLKAHAHRADDIFTAIRIAKEFSVELTLDHCTDGSLISEELGKENFAAIVGPSFGFKTKIELKNKSFKTPGDLQRAGVKVAIMTDSPVIPQEYLSLCAALAIKAGMDEMEALKAITINPAEILGIDDQVGSIEEGKDADLVVFDGNPLMDLHYETRLTMINGEIVYNQI